MSGGGTRSELRTLALKNLGVDVLPLLPPSANGVSTAIARRRLDADGRRTSSAIDVLRGGQSTAATTTTTRTTTAAAAASANNVANNASGDETSGKLRPRSELNRLYRSLRVTRSFRAAGLLRTKSSKKLPHSNEHLAATSSLASSSMSGLVNARATRRAIDALEHLRGDERPSTSTSAPSAQNPTAINKSSPPPCPSGIAANGLFAFSNFELGAKKIATFTAGRSRCACGQVKS